MEFVKFKRAVHAQFNRLAAGADMLFLTNVDKDALWDCYLNSFPEEERQSHNCNNCKHYIRHYGRVVAIKHKENVMVAEITYSKSKGIQIRELIPSTSHSSVSLWNIDTNKFHKVNVMMLSPNYWDEQGIGNKHYFFMLDDCKNPEPVRGFFNEYLNSELTPHRKVFEVLADKMKTPYQEHQLSGLGFSSTMRNSVIVKVDGTFSRTLKVNF